MEHENSTIEVNTNKYLAERNALQNFKTYVHNRLDAAGVPVDPESPHKAEGCRIGGRLDWVLGRIAELERVAMEMLLALGVECTAPHARGAARLTIDQFNDHAQVKGWRAALAARDAGEGEKA